MFINRQRDAPRASTRSESQASPAEALGRRERNKRAKLARIERAARTLFGRQGVEGTTIRQIAAAADIGLGTMFSYATSKEDLLVSIFRDEVGRAVDRAFATVRAQPLLDQVLHVFGAIIVHHEDHLGLARVFVKETPFVDDGRHGIREFVLDLLVGLERLIDRAKARGELKADVPSRMLARNLFGLLIWHLQAWLGPRRPKPKLDAARLRESLELQLIGLRRSSLHGGRVEGGGAWDRRPRRRR